MRRHALTAWALVIFLLLSASAVLAEPLQQDRQVQITSPEMNAELRGIVPILGSALIGDFQFYKVEFGVGPNPSQWAVIGQLHDAPVVNGQLEVWDTAALPDGVYTLRLQAVKQDGNWDEFFVRQLTIANASPSPTPTLEETPTPSVTDTPQPLAEHTPGPTATLLIIQPTAALSIPTPTATRSRPAAQGQELPLEPKSWGQAFCFGGLALGAVFVLLGIVFGVRRLL
ncbi:MAG: hypothetical protein ACYC5M_03410 [Anaerolineae bacterium]